MSHLVTRSITRLSFLLVALFVLTGPGNRHRTAACAAACAWIRISFISAATWRRRPSIDRLYFRPNLEVGFGDDVTLIAANMEFVYKFPSRSGWSIYAGGGPALNIYMVDDATTRDTDAGLNLLVGVEKSSGLVLRIQIGSGRFAGLQVRGGVDLPLECRIGHRGHRGHRAKSSKCEQPLRSLNAFRGIDSVSSVSSVAN